MNVLTIDPGYAKGGKGNACCVSRDGQITNVWFERTPRRASDLAMIRTPLDRVIVERPQMDGRSRGVPPEVLIGLSCAGLGLGGMYAGASDAELIEWTPNDWKGSEGKPINHGRLWAELDRGESRLLGGAETKRQIDAAKRKGALDRWAKPGVAYYPQSWLGHNMLDAAAINLVAVGRLKKCG